MDATLARYPFLAAARQAVEADEVDLAGLVTEGEGPVLERAQSRVEHAIKSGAVGRPHPTPRIELLSYPVARVLVSLIDDAGLTRRYARAEAETAVARFERERAGASLKSVDREPLSLETLLAEFELDEAIQRTDDGFLAGVTTYLDLADGLSDDHWRLVTRELAGGQVPVSEAEFTELLREAIHDRVAQGLPLAVPERVADALSPRVAELRSQLADHSGGWEFDVVEPAGFPPCMEALLERVAGDGELPAHSRFALASFLATVGVPSAAIVDRLAEHPAISRASASSLVDHLADDAGTEYPPPSCATMVAYGDCVNTDALCDRIGHPLDYYERRLDGVDPDTLEARA